MKKTKQEIKANKTNKAPLYVYGLIGFTLLTCGLLSGFSFVTEACPRLLLFPLSAMLMLPDEKEFEDNRICKIRLLAMPICVILAFCFNNIQWAFIGLVVSSKWGGLLKFFSFLRGDEMK